MALRDLMHRTAAARGNDIPPVVLELRQGARIELMVGKMQAAQSSVSRTRTAANKPLYDYYDAFLRIGPVMEDCRPKRGLV